MSKRSWAPIGKRVVTTCKVGSVKAGAAGVVTWRDEAPRSGSMFKQRVAVRFDDYFPDYVIHEEDLAPEPKPVRPGQFVKGGGRATREVTHEIRNDRRGVRSKHKGAGLAG